MVAKAFSEETLKQCSLGVYSSPGTDTSSDTIDSPPSKVSLKNIKSGTIRCWECRQKMDEALINLTFLLHTNKEQTGSPGLVNI